MLLRTIVVVAIASLFVWTPQADGQSLVEDLRIGSMDGPEALTTVRGITVDEQHIYVLQHRDAMVRVFTLDGQPVGIIGGRGSGPGEFQSPSRLGWRADTLWVFDRGLGRVSLFAGGQEFVSSYRSVFDWERYPFVATGPFGMGPQREIIVRPEVPDQAADEVQGSIPLVTASSDGELRHVITEWSSDHTVLRVPISYQGREMALVFRQPFGDDPLWSISSDGTAVIVVNRDADATNARLRVRRWETNTGELLFDRSFPRTARPMTSDRFNLFVDSVIGGLPTELREIRDVRRALVEATYRPRFEPLADDVFVDVHGRAWILMRHSRSDQSEWFIVNSSGESLGHVEVPQGVQLLEADRRYAWGVTSGDFDIPIVVRFRLPHNLPQQ